MNKYDRYKNAYKNKDMKECSAILIDLANENREKLMRQMLVTDSLKNPLAYNYKVKDYQFSIETFYNTLQELEKISCDSILSNQIHEMIIYSHLFFTNNEKNIKRLEKNEFSKYSLSKQLRLLCILYEDQSRLLSNVVDGRIKEKNFITGMEYEISNNGVSFSDNMEFMLEYYNQLLNYLYYKKKDETDIKFIDNHGDLHPYLLSELSELNEVAQQRLLNIKLEEKIRYTEWHLFSSIDKGGNRIFQAIPKNEEHYKAHLTAVFRRSNHINHRVYDLLGTIDYKDDELLMNILIKRMGVLGIENFTISKDEFKKASLLTSIIVTSELSFLRDIYFDIDLNGVTVLEISNCKTFLVTIAEIYILSVYSDFNQDKYSEYKRLVPVIDTKKLLNIFISINNIEADKAEKIFDLFVYKEDLDYKKADIFSRPLIKVASDKVLFSASMIIQLNLSRVIDQVLQSNEIDISRTGFDYEDEIRQKLNANEILSVNTNKVAFFSSDGRDIEFDFIATFKDHLIIIEFKSVYTPYSDSELYRRWGMIKEGVKQVNRRVDVLSKDWKKIRNLVNISLPEEPYEKSKIIKIVCTNIYDFTSIECDGVLLTDDSTLLKYFNDPSVSVKEYKSDLKTLTSKSIWSNGEPTVNEFIRYLKNPVTTRFIKNSFTEARRIIPAFDGQYTIFKNDFILKEDPVEKMVGFMKNSKDKYYPNDSCPCGSGKKFKKCCKE